MNYVTGAQIIVQLLEQQGIEVVAGIPGGAVIPLYDTLRKSSITHVLVRHEQAAGFFAQGIARTTGKPAVCIATSGPGVMNLLTAVADAKADSVPLVVITGQVSTSFIGTDAFQEADTFGLALAITKHNLLVKNAADLLTVIPQAFSIASSGRPGPVLIDIPVDVQRQKIPVTALPQAGEKIRRSERFRTQGAELVLQCAEFARVLLGAQRPLLFVGGGCNSPEAAALVQQFLQVFPMPVASSLMGLGVVPSASPFFCGMTGVYGTAQANAALSSADVIVAAGVRFDERSIGNPPFFAPDARILHIDIDAAEINKIMESYRSVTSDVESAIPVLTECISQAQKTASRISSPDWATAEQLPVKDNTQTVFSVTTAGKCLLGQQLMQVLHDAAERRLCGPVLVTSDVGQHQMWTARAYPFCQSRQFLTSGALGTMGFSLPAALGAAWQLRHHNGGFSRVLCLSGDGSIMMNIQELATLAELQLDVTVFVFDNGGLAMVQQLQDKQCCKKHFSVAYESPSQLVLIAESFGIPSRTVGAGSLLENPSGTWADFAFPPAGSGPRFISCTL